MHTKRVRTNDKQQRAGCSVYNNRALIHNNTRAAHNRKPTHKHHSQHTNTHTKNSSSKPSIFTVRRSKWCYWSIPITATPLLRVLFSSSSSNPSTEHKHSFRFSIEASTKHTAPLPKHKQRSERVHCNGKWQRGRRTATMSTSKQRSTYETATYKHAPAQTHTENLSNVLLAECHINTHLLNRVHWILWVSFCAERESMWFAMCWFGWATQQRASPVPCHKYFVQHHFNASENFTLSDLPMYCEFSSESAEHRAN